MAKSVLLVLVFCCARAEASTLLYSFTGDNGLSGTFTLDDTAAFIITETPRGELFARLSSPLNTLQGSLGPYTFTGTQVELLTFHDYYAPLFPPPNDFHRSQWTIIAFLTGPPVNGLSPAQLTMFIENTVDPANFPSLIPPPIPTNPDNFRYSFITADRRGNPGQLNTVVLVPEPSSLLLLAFGSLPVFAYIRVRRTSS